MIYRRGKLGALRCLCVRGIFSLVHTSWTRARIAMRMICTRYSWTLLLCRGLDLWHCRDRCWGCDRRRSAGTPGLEGAWKSHTRLGVCILGSLSSRGLDIDARHLTRRIVVRRVIRMVPRLFSACLLIRSDIRRDVQLFRSSTVCLRSSRRLQSCSFISTDQRNKSSRTYQIVQLRSQRQTVVTACRCHHCSPSQSLRCLLHVSFGSLRTRTKLNDGLEYGPPLNPAIFSISFTFERWRP